MLKYSLYIVSLLSIVSSFAFELIVPSHETISFYVKAEVQEGFWQSEEAYKRDLEGLVKKMDAALDKYMKLAKAFKTFLVPLIKKWAEQRARETTPLLEWAKQPLANKEGMYKNITSFARLEQLVQDIGLFVADIGFQNQYILKKCKQYAEKDPASYVAEFIKKYQSISFVLPGLDMLERVNLVNAEKTLSMLEIVGILLYGNA